MDIKRLCVSHPEKYFHNYVIKALKRFVGEQQIR